MNNNRNNFNGIRILVFGSRGRQALPICKGFKKLGCHVTSYCISRLDTGYMTRYADNRVLYDENNVQGYDYLEYGKRLIIEGSFDLVVPLVDETAAFLSKHKDELSQYTRIAVNDWEVFKKILDKSQTMKICEENGIPAPRTIFCDIPDFEIFKKSKMRFPVVVKPKTSIGSIGFNIVNNEETLQRLLASYDNAFGPLLIQDYIEQGDYPQYGAEMFRDRDGIFRMCMVTKVVRWYPIDGGSRLCSVSIHDDAIVASCKKLLNALDWNGYANIDLVWDVKQKEAKILEINGRTGASLKLDFLAGIDVCKLILENELGMTVEDMLDYEDGKEISCFMVDVLWLIHAKNRFSAKPSWFNRFHIKDTVFSWDDPLPTLGFVIQSISQFRSSMEKRRRVER